MCDVTILPPTEKAIVYPEHDNSGRPTQQTYAYIISNNVMPAFQSQQYSGLSTKPCIVCCPLPNTNCNCNNCVYILCVPSSPCHCCYRYPTLFPLLNVAPTTVAR